MDILNAYVLIHEYRSEGENNGNELSAEKGAPH